MAKKQRDAFASTRPYLIEALLPAYEVHILGGPSGVNKTRWLFQMLANWSKGNSIFGFASNPVPYVYVSTDRSYASVCETLRDLEIDPDTVPIMPALDSEGEGGYSIPWLFGQIKEDYPEAQFVILEGIATFVPKGEYNNYSVVASFLRKLSRACRKNKVTILGVHHTAKEKGGKTSGYENDREKLLGSAAWSAFAETVFVMNFHDSSDRDNPYRVLSVFPRNKSADFVVTYRKGEHGRLTQLGVGDKPASLSTKGAPRDAKITSQVQMFVDELRMQGRKDFALQEILVKLGNEASRATLCRRCETLCQIGVLKNSKHGTYEILEEVPVASKQE